MRFNAQIIELLLVRFPGLSCVVRHEQYLLV